VHRLKDWWARLREDKRWWRFVFLVALLLRGAYAVMAPRIDPFLQASPLHGDAGSYDRIARNLLAGHGYAEWPGRPTAFWPPLYPWLLAGIYGVFGYRPWAARMIQAVLGAVGVTAAARAADGALGRRTALLAGLGMALYPHLIYFGAWLIAEALYIVLLGLLLWVAVTLQKKSKSTGFAALGILLGLATLAKPATLMLLPFMAFWVLVAPPARKARVRLLHCLLVLVLAAVTILPWTVRNRVVLGALVPVSTNGGYTFYGANNPAAFGGHREGFPPHLDGLTEAEAEREYYRLGIAWILNNPDDFARLTIRKVVRLFSPLSVASFEQDYPLPFPRLVKGLHAVFLVLAGVGAALALARWRQALMFYILIARVLIGTIVFYGDARYTLPMVPSLVIFASLALVSVRPALHVEREAGPPQEMPVSSGRSA
jgi:4-amino-4-deoxy-L-arabinose transferase-like glycosyltransferase